MKKWVELAKDTRGATMVEYVVILALIFLVAVAAWDRLGQAVNTKTGNVADKLEQAGGN